MRQQKSHQFQHRAVVLDDRKHVVVESVLSNLFASVSCDKGRHTSPTPQSVLRTMVDCAETVDRSGKSDLSRLDLQR